jgi:hypothetical protein
MSILMEYMGYNPYDNIGPDEYYEFCKEQGLKEYSSEAHYAWINREVPLRTPALSKRVVITTPDDDLPF